MLVNYEDIVKQIIETDVSIYKKDVMKNKGDNLTELEKLLYSEQRFPLITNLVIGDIVVQLSAIKDNTKFIIKLWMTDGHPVVIDSVTKITDDIILSESDDIFETINMYNMYISLICKINKEQLKIFPQIVNITNI